MPEQPEVSGPTAAPCPHHPATPVEHDGHGQAGCPHVDQLVMVLSGLVGTTTAAHELPQPLAVVGRVIQSAVEVQFVPSAIDIPPPRA